MKAKKFNVAGQKYTDNTNAIEDVEIDKINNGFLPGQILSMQKQILDLRRDLDSTAKIQGDMLKRDKEEIFGLTLSRP